MQVRSGELFQKLEKMAAHYKNNVASTHLKAEFSSMPLTRRDWDEVELLTSRLEVFRHQGYHLDELYLKLLSMSRLVKQARTQMAPGLKGRMNTRMASRPNSDKVMAEMAVANFLPNVAVLAEMILELYNFTRQEDAAQNEGKTKALSSVPEAKEIENLLQA